MSAEGRGKMTARRRIAIALTGLVFVTRPATVAVRAQDRIGPVAHNLAINKLAVKTYFTGVASMMVSTREQGSLMSGDGLLQASLAPPAALDSHGQSGPVEASGSVFGAVEAVDGAPVGDARVTLTATTALQHQTLSSDVNGNFAFTQVPPGTYSVTVQAKGFLPYTSARFTVAARQAVEVAKIELSIAPLKTEVVVRPTEVIAQMQIKAQEKQRVLGVFPNFYTSYTWNAAPLNTRQKFSLSARDLLDPVSLVGVAASAGIEQANNSFAGYGQGAAGYGKRFAAALADDVTGSLLSQAVFPSIFHQDPRYFYQGSGSVKRRLIHALGWVVILRSDSGRPMPNYSYWLGGLASGALSNLYYPPADRGVGLVLTNFAIGVGIRAGDTIFQEFLLKHLTTHVPGKGKP
jgi:hypothetical protein